MPSPLLKYPDATVVLPAWMCPPAAYYAVMARYGHAKIISALPFNKRIKSFHRFDIADVNGRQQITIPIVKPEHTHGALWSDILVSTHNSWWNIARTALASAYGRTPFYEFLADEVNALLDNPVTDAGTTALHEISKGFDQITRHLLHLDTEVEYISDPAENISGDLDLTRPEALEEAMNELPAIVYRQVRQQSLGFISGLSILDLIFNLGTEAPLYFPTVHPQD